jgi:hypothetical protein
MFYFKSGGRLYRAHAEQDPEPLDPREEYDNLSTMALWWPRMSIGDIEANSAEDIMNHIRELIKKYRPDEEKLWELDLPHLYEFIVKEDLPICAKLVRGYEHSGFTISTANSYPYTDKWDGGYCGICYIEKEQAFKELNATEDNWRDFSSDIIEDEVETYDRFLNGSVYGIIIEKPVSYTNDDDKDDHILEWEEADSCYGFYSDKFGEELEEDLTKELYYPIEKCESFKEA